jgi:hypothetical protein
MKPNPPGKPPGKGQQSSDANFQSECDVRYGSKAEKLRQSKCFPLYSQHRTFTRVLSCRINIGGPLAPRMRTSCAPGGRRTSTPSGRSQPCDPLASKLGQRTQPKLCGGPNTIFDVSFFISWDFFYQHAAVKIAQHSVPILYDDGDEVDLPEDRYRAQGYDPLL